MELQIPESEYVKSLAADNTMHMNRACGKLLGQCFLEKSIGLA
jgi:hypothetical protein